MPWSLRTRRAGLVAASAAIPLALAYRFALVYRVRAGYPKRHVPRATPAAVGLAWEDVEVPTPDGLRLPGWFVPGEGASSSDPSPAVVLVHGWESARDRALPHAQFLHAAGFSVLAVDVRGHGANGPEALPVSVGEFAADARAAAAWLRARDDVARVGVLGHSVGGAGALVAAAADPAISAVVAIAPPAGPYRLTRQTFRLADLPFPGPVAWPLAWLTTHVYLRPRGHRPADISATQAVKVTDAPVLLVHGSDDRVLPVSHHRRLVAARRAARPDAVTETLVLDGGEHSWAYEFPAFRATVARFLAASLGGRLDPDDAAALAEAEPAVRLPDDDRLTALDDEPGGVRSVARILRPQAPAP
jgi:alpha-beta hydrolase superfamily lysophospholipase